MWVWNKDPSGRYNAHNPLQLDNANKWVDTILKISALKTLQIEVTSRKWDHYDVNDSVMFFNLRNKELANYHSYYTFAQRLNIDPELLKKVVIDFDKLGLNRFYREANFIAFKTETSLSFSRGYFYFLDTTITETMKAGDLLDFRSSGELKYFRQAMFDRFLVIKKYDRHWVEWEEAN
jgi:hypothetical protein